LIDAKSVEEAVETSEAEPHPDDAADKSPLILYDSDCGDNTNSTASIEENDNGGKLIVDAICAPADIRFPTDISLLNEAREKTDDIIDELQRPLRGNQPRPRTYRRKARRVFLNFIKRKKPGAKLIRKTKKKLLNLLKRNFKAIDALLQNPDAFPPAINY